MLRVRWINTRIPVTRVLIGCHASLPLSLLVHTWTRINASPAPRTFAYLFLQICTDRSLCAQRAHVRVCVCRVQGQGGEGDSVQGGQQGAVSSFGGSFSNVTPEDLSWAKDLDPIIDTHLGEGSSVFR